jgi:hypothetical protein
MTGAYIPFNDDETPPTATIIGCGNHTIFVNGECFACGRPSQAIVKASNKMIQPEGDLARNKLEA